MFCILTKSGFLLLLLLFLTSAFLVEKILNLRKGVKGRATQGGKSGLMVEYLQSMTEALGQF